MPVPLELVFNIASFSVSNHVLMIIVQQKNQIYVGFEWRWPTFGMAPAHFQRQRLSIFCTFCQVDGTLRLAL